MIDYRLCILLLCLMMGCTPSNVPGVSTPVAPVQLADPSIMYDKGNWYLYGTGTGNTTDGFRVYTSRNLVSWSGPAGVSDGLALKKGDSYGTAKFWAPQVFAYNNQYYMAYAANEHIAIAVSDSPLGPFRQLKTGPVSTATRQIDPYVFIDDDGKKYLYYVVVANGANRIYVSELNNDLLNLKKDEATLCIEATQSWENTQQDNWSVTEGPSVIKHNDVYYLIYSANHFKSIDYAVGYATSLSPTGPWQKYEGNPIIHRNITGQNGGGHGDIVKGKDGQWLYVFHTHFSADQVSPRKTAMIKLDFISDKKNKIDKLVADTASFRYLFH